MQMYNPETKITLSIEEIALKYNTSIPDDIEEFEGWYKLYYDVAPDYNEYQLLKEEPIALIDGHYRLTYTVEDKPIDLIKSMKVEEVSLKFADIEEKAHVLSSLGFTIDANEKANRDIEGLIKVLMREGTETTLFRDFNNNFHEVSLNDLEIMQIEIIKNGQNLYQQKWRFEQEIFNSKETDELLDINIEFQNMNFGE